MLNEVLQLVPSLLIVMVLNNLCGVYQKLGLEKITFNWKVFLNGVLKTVIIFAGLIGVAYVCDRVNFLDIENTPIIIIKGAIIGYTAKVTAYLYKILNASVSQNENIHEERG